MNELSPHTRPAHVEQALRVARERLGVLYGDRLAGVILYGSVARGDARPDSDVDLLVVLRGAYDAYAEIKRLAHVELELLEAFDLLFSIQPYGEEEVSEGAVSFVRNVRDEGVFL